MASAPATADLVSLTNHVRGYMKRVGKAENGTPKTFYFGKDEASAKVAAWQKMKEWDDRAAQAKALGIDGVTWETDLSREEKKAASKVWSKWERGGDPKPSSPGYQLAVKEATESIATIDAETSELAEFREWQRQRRGEAPSPTSGSTIVAAKDQYLNNLKRRIGLVGSLGIDEWTYSQTAHKLNRAMEFIPPTVTHLHQLDYATLQNLVYVLASRPKKKGNPLASADVQKAQKKEQVSQRTALGWIQEIKTFLLWTADEPAFNWSLPKKAHELWTIRPEAEEQKIVTVTQDQIKTLWHGAINEKARTGDKGKRRRLFLMLGLNCGFYGVDIATLTPDMIKQEGDTTYIWKLRRKTRKTNSKLARTRWKLWPETAALLKEYMPLTITPNQMRLAWERLTVSTKVKVSHSHLRDTGAVFMERVGGRELADCYLAHARGGVIDSYSHPDWEKLSSALDRLYNEVVSPAIH